MCAAWQWHTTTTCSPCHLCCGAQGIWVYTCAIHRFVDSRRKDYFVMYIHHIVTIALVGKAAIGGAPCYPPSPTLTSWLQCFASPPRPSHVCGHGLL